MPNNVIQRTINPEIGRQLVSLGATRPIAEMYARRFESPKKAIKSFQANLSMLDNYSQIKDLDKGSELIANILNEDGIVALICDSDCDGQSAANIISRFSQETGWRDRLIILTPNRLTDGYGANPEIVDIAIEKGADIILTADNGIMAYAAAKRAKEMEIPFIVTDHHQPGDHLPDATAIINPAQKDCQYLDGILCGASVLYMLILELQKKLKCNYGVNPTACDMYRLLQILAFATIADCVPLNGGNRAIVNEGLKVMRTNPYPSFAHFFDTKNVSGNSINVELISYSIAPVINSSGRLGSAGPSIDFLCSDNDHEIQKLLIDLKEINDKRRNIQAEVLSEATQEAEKFIKSHPESKVLIVGKKEWHHGVVGIVAGRLTESFRRPAIVFGGSQQDINILKGSGRAGDSNLHLKNLLDDVAKFLPDAAIGWGGHAKAAGISLKAKALHVFISQTNISATEMGEDKPAPHMVDEIYHEIIENEARIFEWLNAGPFGQEFPMPTFVIYNAKIKNFKAAKSNTAIFKIGNLKCLGFNIADKLEGKSRASFIVSPKIGFFNGNYSKELVIQALIK